MKVAELILELQSMPQDADVHYSYNYGDYWRTIVAPKVRDISDGMVKHSEYHSMDKLIGDEDDYYDDEGNFKQGLRQVVVLG